MSTSTLTRASLVILVIGFLVMFVGGGSRFAIGLVLKPMVQDLNWTRSTIGGAAALFLAASASCMFVSGRLADKFSLRMLLSGGLLIATVGIGMGQLLLIGGLATFLADSSWRSSFLWFAVINMIMKQLIKDNFIESLQ